MIIVIISNDSWAVFAPAAVQSYLSGYIINYMLNYIVNTDKLRTQLMIQLPQLEEN